MSALTDPTAHSLQTRRWFEKPVRFTAAADRGVTPELWLLKPPVTNTSFLLYPRTAEVGQPDSLSRLPAEWHLRDAVQITHLRELYKR
jgi:hypothetical protein